MGGKMTNRSTTTGTTTNSGDRTVRQKITSLRHFYVHFRRPEKAGYSGSFGFDWLRDEYVYDEIRVRVAKAKKALYKGNIQNLIKEYTHFKGQKISHINEIKTLNAEPYIPAWLAIFPSTKHTKHNNASSKINTDGVKLYLQIDQDDKDSAKVLTDDGTELIFECSTGLKISPEKINLAKLIEKSPTKKNLSSSHQGVSSKSFYRHLTKTAITITATDVYSEPAYIKVIARKNNLKKTVGLLMVYPNAIIPKADIRIVHFSTRAGVREVPTPPAYQDYLKKRSFNQALVRAEIKGISFFNLVDYLNEYNAKVVKGTITSEERRKLGKIKVFITKYPIGQTVPRSKGGELKKDIIALYEEFSQKYVPKGGIENPNSKITFVIFTDYLVQNTDPATSITYTTLGSAATRERGMFESLACLVADCPIIWGNAVVLFNQGNTDLSTFAHEIGHSLSLPHTFETPPNSNHTFYQGYTDNLMDYSYVPVPKGERGESNKFAKYMWSLFKWQWEILRKDSSISYK